MAYEPGPVWEGNPKSTHESYADAQAKTSVSIVSSDGVEFLVADFHLKAHSRVWRDILSLDATAKEDPIQLRLEESAAVLEVLFDAMTQFERQETLFRHFNNGANSPTAKQIENDMKLFPAVHKAMDKYSLSALMEGDLLSRTANFLPALSTSSNFSDVVDLWLTALRIRHKPLFLATSRFFRDFAGSILMDNTSYQHVKEHWVYKRPSEWPLAIIETLGLSSYHLLIRTMYSESNLSLKPKLSRQYWDNFMGHACWLGFPN